MASTSSRETVADVKPKLRGWLHLGTAPLTLAAGIVLIALSPTADDPGRLRPLRRHRAHRCSPSRRSTTAAPGRRESGRSSGGSTTRTSSC